MGSKEEIEQKDVVANKASVAVRDYFDSQASILIILLSTLNTMWALLLKGLLVYYNKKTLDNQPERRNMAII